MREFCSSDTSSVCVRETGGFFCYRGILRGGKEGTLSSYRKLREW